MTDWRARRAYLRAREWRDKFAVYGLDLLWLLVKKQYPEAELTQPSDMRGSRKKDNRTAEQIKQDIVRKFS